MPQQPEHNLEPGKFLTLPEVRAYARTRGVTLSYHAARTLIHDLGSKKFAGKLVVSSDKIIARFAAE